MKTAALLLLMTMLVTGCVSSRTNNQIVKPGQRRALLVPESVSPVDNWQKAYDSLQHVAQYGQ